MTNDYFILAGKESFVFKLVLPSVGLAFTDFEAYIKNLNWPEPINSRLKTHLNLVQSTLKDYRQLQPGSSVNLPPI